jgi:glutathione synthase/RimK-type ligase-like ATP-grasp enzyme
LKKTPVNDKDIMEIGLLLNSNNKLCSYTYKFKEILIKNNLPFVLIDPNSYSLLDDLKKCSHLLFRHTMADTDALIYDAIFNIASNVFKIKCFPDLKTSWPYENKIKEYYLLKSHGFPIIDSHIFWNYDHALKFLKGTSFPLIAKLPKGAGSSNVILINSVGDSKKILNQVFIKGVKSHKLKSRSNLTSISKLGIYGYGKSWLKSELIRKGLLKDKEHPEWQIQKDAILFQKFLPDNTFDTRIAVIGNRALGFRRFVRKDDFRASGSGNFDMDSSKIDLRCVELAFTVSKKLDFTTMAYDFIYDANKRPWISEISYNFVDSLIQKCPGFWDDNLTWHSIQNWPQYYQLSDFLLINDLKGI